MNVRNRQKENFSDIYNRIKEEKSEPIILLSFSFSFLGLTLSFIRKTLIFNIHSNSQIQTYMQKEIEMRNWF